ncbi:hypothetical protein FisN_15Lh046 [Fistulifera solaris]|uniref:PXA domain-containing protein n=1 Tax=Fistulifera solaris TaxID=1519565 RepID=A0A1Z5KHI1_FISSO|nr:hypothetical protein FisN_15Lh046 [Fistulifera solaris]|eukprot:GAX25677.1 hypothetical protein FisN_15Lh046 [Fistulifera solaris]
MKEPVGDFEAIASADSPNPAEAFEREQVALQMRLKQVALLVPPAAWKYGIPALLAVGLASPHVIVRWLLYFVRQVLGVAVGVALGLGFVCHVYDTLTIMREKHERANEGLVRPSSTQFASLKGSMRPPSGLQLSKSPSSMAAAAIEDEQTFKSLMMSAGYYRDTANRGQVVTADTAWLHQPNYGFDGNPEAPRHALRHLQEYWPTLPPAVLEKLALLIEYVLRDFVGCWYKSVDEGCKYRDAGALRKEEAEKKIESDADEILKEKSQSKSHARVMLYTLSTYRRSPFLTSLYNSMAVLFGNLATRVEHVNLPALVLLQWARVLAHTFKVYRNLRKSILTKHLSGSQTNKGLRESRRTLAGDTRMPANPVSEIDMTKEFLFAGKLHKAVTFGLDVPALLFADATGRECGVPGDSAGSTENEVLARRLFETGMIRECELDYNRVLSHRIVRALVTRQDFGSPIVSSLLTEILAGCALTPLMNIFSPEYLNSWIIKGLSSTRSEEPAAGAADSSDNTTCLVTETEDRDVRDGDGVTSFGGDNSTRSLQGVGAEVPEISIVDKVVREEKRKTLSSAVVPEINTSVSSAEDSILSLLALALIDVQRYVDFDDYRLARKNNQMTQVDWDDPGCREAVLRLVLVIELALTHGRCTYRAKERLPKEAEIHGDDDADFEDFSEDHLEESLYEYGSTTLSQILMEMTSDVDSFEERVARENALEVERKRAIIAEMNVEDYCPTVAELSTIRTLIAAWLHTGQIFRNVSILVQAQATVLLPYFHSHAFVRSKNNVDGFVKQIKALDNVEILVDTMAVLSSQRLDAGDGDGLKQLVQKLAIQSPKIDDGRHIESTKTDISSVQLLGSPTASSRYLDFHRNDSFASSLRSERERRMRSWQLVITGDEKEYEPICRSRGLSHEDATLHREMHNLSRIFYKGTNLIAIRDAARRKKSADNEEFSIAGTESDDGFVSLLTVETASPRRKIEVPDDDSSFLLRAQPKNLNAVGVHRDQRNHDQSFKCFAATFEERVSKPGLNPAASGKYLRRCLIRYYPIDRTASIAMLHDSRKLDQRKCKVPETITLDEANRNSALLSTDFLQERHLCNRHLPRGTTRSQSILASSVIEPSDFTSMPRPGKAMDFIFRLSFFENPMVDLEGRYFTIHDSSVLGVHRSDASAMEFSDASLSTVLCMIGDTAGETKSSTTDSSSQGVQMGKDGYPVIWMKFSGDDTKVEMKPYRASFVRAALLVTEARQEAQLQCLLSCVKSGSATNATKALIDSILKPTYKLIEYAGNRSREKQSIVLRDLKLGVNHIDRAQLRRNGLLDPRYPTTLLDMTARIEEALQSNDDRPGADFFGVSATSYKIRCTVKVRVADVDADGNEGLENSSRMCQEEWVVHRSFKDFQTLHKHLKTQLAASLSSGTPASRLVGAATAAFAPAASSQGRQRQPFIASLSQASKAGALGVTKKSILKRMEILNEYLLYLLAPGNPVRLCSELVLFLGAFYPLPQDLNNGEGTAGESDILGRTEISRIVLEEPERNAALSKQTENTTPEEIDQFNTSMSMANGDIFDIPEEDAIGGDGEFRKSRKDDFKIASVKAKIEKIPLGQVRQRVFELLRYQFGFENASFIRNRMLAALKTASLALTPGEFQRTLYKLHVEHLSGDSIAGLIQKGLDLIWPEGVFFEAQPPYTREQLDALVKGSKEALHSSFPEAVRAVLGQDLTKDGLDIFHEMLQNRLVVKSMAYMLFDLLWLEVFPEIGDVLQCGGALDIPAEAGN